eukprot:15450343-Alexandrium_andersonii.AAC.1
MDAPLHGRMDARALKRTDTWAHWRQARMHGCTHALTNRPWAHGRKPRAHGCTGKRAHGRRGRTGA